MNKFHVVPNVKRVIHSYFGEGEWCATHNSFWGDEYPHCSHIKNGELCVPEREGENVKPDTIFLSTVKKEVKNK